MRKYWVWIVAGVLVLFSLVLLSDAKSIAIHHVLRNEVALTAYAERCMERPEEAVRYGSWNTRRSETDGVIIFEVSYVGFGSESNQKGFYYSPEDEATGLGNDQEREPTEKGIRFSGDGDNYTYVEKIADHWYWFERHW